MFSDESPCNFNFIGKTVPFPSTDIIMVAQFFFFCFFPQKGVIIFFHKTVKPECKVSFSKVLKSWN